MTKIIYLIRHAQASFGQADYDQVSLLGLEQSTLLGTALAQKPETLDTWVSGTLKRHNQTFAQACPDCDPPEKNVDWNEFDHQDIFKARMTTQGISREQAQAFDDRERLSFFHAAIADWILSENPEAYRETWPEFQQRIARAFEATVERTEQAALVFTSGGPIATLIGQQWQLNPEQTMRINRSLVNTGISKLIVSRHGVQVTTINEHTHLEQQDKRLITYT